MPLSTDTQVVETSKGLVATLRNAAGPHPGFRPGPSPCITRSRTPHSAPDISQPVQRHFLTKPNTAHAKGHLLTGTFTPSAKSSKLSSAPHFNAPSTPITVRFSSSTGIPKIADTDPNGNPRGIAIRFHLPDVNGRRAHTDIVAHSTKFFPTRTGAEFLEFLKAATGNNAGEAVPEFLGRHPETVRFLDDPKPSPVSFGTQHYFGVNAFKFVKKGKVTVFRYRIVPVAGEQYVSEEDLKTKSETYLFDELPRRLESGPIDFKLLAQIAEDGDVTDDATVMWPEERSTVELGIIRVENTLSAEKSLKEQKHIIFDPIPRVEGVDVTDDPLLDVRASVYLISGKQRRCDKDSEVYNDARSAAVKSAT
jgi:catalase